MMHRLLLLTALLLPSVAIANEWSLHTVSYHFGSNDLESVTPGITYSVEGYRFGYIRNSHRLDSLLMAKEFPIKQDLRFGLGVISGYRWSYGRTVGDQKGVMLLVALEKDLLNNVSLLWFGRAVNLVVKF